MSSIRTCARLSLLAPLLLIGACGSENAASEQGAELAGQEGAEWGYEGAGAPGNWASLSAENAACETGTAQSPINLADAAPADLPDPQFNYQPSPAAIENKGHTLQVNYAPGSMLSVGDERYELA
jgi:carbonic anhydrase